MKDLFGKLATLGIKKLVIAGVCTVVVAGAVTGGVVAVNNANKVVTLNEENGVTVSAKGIKSDYAVQVNEYDSEEEVEHVTKNASQTDYNVVCTQILDIFVVDKDLNVVELKESGAEVSVKLSDEMLENENGIITVFDSDFNIIESSVEDGVATFTLNSFGRFYLTCGLTDSDYEVYTASLEKESKKVDEIESETETEEETTTEVKEEETKKEESNSDNATNNSNSNNNSGNVNTNSGSSNSSSSNSNKNNNSGNNTSNKNNSNKNNGSSNSSNNSSSTTNTTKTIKLHELTTYYGVIGFFGYQNDECLEEYRNLIGASSFMEVNSAYTIYSGKCSLFDVHPCGSNRIMFYFNVNQGSNKSFEIRDSILAEGYDLGDPDVVNVIVESNYLDKIAEFN